jgi:hypothetical protein
LLLCWEWGTFSFRFRSCGPITAQELFFFTVPHCGCPTLLLIWGKDACCGVCLNRGGFVADCFACKSACRLWFAPFTWSFVLKYVPPCRIYVKASHLSAFILLHGLPLWDCYTAHFIVQIVTWHGQRPTQETKIFVPIHAYRT